MAAAIIIQGKRHGVDAGITLSEAVVSCGLLPNAFLYLKKGVPVPSDTVLEDGMEINAIKIASGG
ncbi:MAG: hypothetical protein ACOX8L_02035 [Candidatus Methanomethylophilaceae archaeon]|jgi:sulfur carrier protein ThiS